MKKEYIISRSFKNESNKVIGHAFSESALTALVDEMIKGYEIIFYNEFIDSIKIKYPDGDTYYIFPKE